MSERKLNEIHVEQNKAKFTKKLNIKDFDFLYNNNGINMTTEERMNYFKIMAAHESRIYNRYHHIAKIFSSIFIINSYIYFLYHVTVQRSRISPQLMKLSFQSKYFIPLILLTAFNINIHFLKNHYLDHFVYKNYYSQLTDEEFFELYSSIVHKKIMKIV